MSTETPQRVRIVLADLARARRPLPRLELDDQTSVGEELVRGLVRAQLSLALRLAVVVIVGLGGLPLLFALAPQTADVRPFGIALPWLLLGVLAYPFLVLVGWWYNRLAERNERDFVDLVGTGKGDGE